MTLLWRCLMNVRAVAGEVDPPPLPCIDASISSKPETALQLRFVVPVTRASSLEARGSTASASVAALPSASCDLRG